MKININNYAYFTLTAHGAEIYNNRYNSIPKQFRMTYHTKEGDIVKMQIWEIIKVFGEHTGLGMHSFCEACVLDIEEK